MFFVSVRFCELRDGSQLRLPIFLLYATIESRSCSFELAPINAEATTSSWRLNESANACTSFVEACTSAIVLFKLLDRIQQSYPFFRPSAMPSSVSNPFANVPRVMTDAPASLIIGNHSSGRRSNRLYCIITDTAELFVKKRSMTFGRIDEMPYCRMTPSFLQCLECFNCFSHIIFHRPTV